MDTNSIVEELTQERDRVVAAFEALRDGTRLLSAYHLKDGTKIWGITELG